MNKVESYLLQGAEGVGVALSRQQLDDFETVAAELCKWNRKINLTSIILPEEIAIKHFVDSLALAAYVGMEGTLLDIGSGAGFPAIPLKIVCPDIEVVTVDAVEKKILFQRHVARLLGFQGFTAVHSRIECLPAKYDGAFNIIVSRAFSELTEFVKCALPFLTADGVIVAMKGRDGKNEADVSANALRELGALILTVHEFELPLLKDSRSLIIIKKQIKPVVV